MSDEYQIRDFWDQPIDKSDLEKTAGEFLKRTIDENKSILEEYWKLQRLGIACSIIYKDGKMYIKPV